MSTLGRSQGSSTTEPRIALWTQVLGRVKDVAALKFQLWSLGDTPAQVYPVSGKQDATKVTTGRYVAVWSGAGVSGYLGLWEVRWFLTVAAGDDEQTFAEEFEVIENAPVVDPGYGFVADVRAEGVTTAQASDVRVVRALHLASRVVERATGRKFRPEGRTVRVDGHDAAALVLDEPIVGVESITVLRRAGLGAADLDVVVDVDSVEVYNRHLQGLMNPDDRDDPKLSFFRATDHLPAELDSLVAGYLGGSWPFGQGNISIKGVFGYTDPSGANPQGVTPDLIRRAAMLIALRSVHKVGTPDSEDARGRHLVSSEHTKDQGYSKHVSGSHPGLIGDGWTSDPEIDAILASFTAPFGMGAA